MRRVKQPANYCNRFFGVAHGRWAVVGALALVGCSGPASPVSSKVEPNTVTTIAATSAPAVTTAPPPPAAPVVIKVTTRVGDRSVSDEVTLAPETTSDPFGRYATCSGAWESFGAYNMLVSNPSPTVGSVQVSSVDNIRRSGQTRATARVEWGSDLYLSTGILAFGDDFSVGTFGGKIADGRDITIDFVCESDRQPVPIDRTRQFVDVAALLRKDGHERIVSTGVAQGCNGGLIDVPADAESPYAQGAITAVKVTPDTLAIQIGDRALEFASQSISPRDSTSGTFRAETTDGITVTGAYYCRQ